MLNSFDHPIWTPKEMTLLLNYTGSNLTSGLLPHAPAQEVVIQETYAQNDGEQVEVVVIASQYDQHLQQQLEKTKGGTIKD